jgi:hypothetical protein
MIENYSIRTMDVHDFLITSKEDVLGHIPGISDFTVTYSEIVLQKDARADLVVMLHRRDPKTRLMMGACVVLPLADIALDAQAAAKKLVALAESVL